MSSLLLSLMRLSPTRDQMVAHLGTISVEGLVGSAFEGYAFTLTLGTIWLLLGLRLNFGASHLGVPVLLWALEASLDTHRSLDYGFPHSLYFIETLLASAFALGLVFVLIVLALALGRKRALTQGDLLGLAGPAFAVLAVLLDWGFLLFVTIPLPA